MQLHAERYNIFTISRAMRAMNNMQTILLLGGVALLAGCSQEAPPRSVHDFLDEPILLEATMVRCAQNREETRYDAECVNARQAVSLIEAREERARRDAFERESERKREALIRTQKAAAEARRRAAEAEALQRESEYLAQFGESPPVTVEQDGEQAANAPMAVIPQPEEAQEDTTVIFDDPPAPAGSNAPAAESEAGGDLDAVRDELRRRAEDAGT
ncbi:MAG: EexN family lipoprotein [Gammaproteobacteria bacterium]|nr:EexN family lipoprotein [Gammaproteobacteria bacterium]